MSNKKTKKQSKFLPTARLTRLQRKYCDCLMGVRENKPSQKYIRGDTKNYPYAVCYSTLRKSRKLNKSKKAKSKFHKELNPYSVNCTMNYDMSKYSTKSIQALAIEKDIPTTYISKEKSRKSLNRTTLIKKLTEKYVKNKSKNNKIIKKVIK